MSLCILCFNKTIEQESQEILKDTSEENTITSLITQHLSFLDVFSDDRVQTNFCCNLCVQVLQDFNQFYQDIQAKHLHIKDAECEEITVDEMIKSLAPDQVLLTNCMTSSAFKSVLKSNDSRFESRQRPKTRQNQENNLIMESNVDRSLKQLDSEKQLNEPIKRGRPKSHLKQPPFRASKRQFSDVESMLKAILPGKTYRRRTVEDDKKIMNSIEMKCDVCNETLQSFSHALAHHKLIHNQIGYLTCCSRKFKQRSSLIDHLDFHDNPECFKCKICDKTFKARSNLRTHITIIHLPQIQFECDICGKSLNCKYRMASHLKSHFTDGLKTETFSCPEKDCSKSFTTKSALKCHTNNCHNPSRQTFWCEVCGKELMSKHSLQEHIKNTHGEMNTKIQCLICGHYIKNEYSMKKHIFRHKTTQQNIKCELCGRHCVTKAALRSHMRMKHLLQRNLPCRFCDKMFKEAIAVTEHEATHTGVDLYSCLWCPASFKFGANFRAHRKSAHPEEYEKIKPKWLRPN